MQVLFTEYQISLNLADDLKGVWVSINEVKE